MTPTSAPEVAPVDTPPNGTPTRTMFLSMVPPDYVPPAPPPKWRAAASAVLTFAAVLVMGLLVIQGVHRVAERMDPEPETPAAVAAEEE